MFQAITKGANAVISDLLDVCCRIQPGDEVVIASHIDGTQGGDNLVDEQTVYWIQQAVISRKANPTILWFDESAQKSKWRVPPVFLSALRACDVMIFHSFDLNTEEMRILLEMANEYGTRLCRNFASTVGLLNSKWAQTPYELLAEIRAEACKPFKNGGMPYVLEDPNGTHLEGMVLPTTIHIFPGYSSYRAGSLSYLPFPEWVFPPINIGSTNGVLVFDRMLSWWSRYIGVPPVFKNPIELEIKDNRIIRITGKEEADALKRFMERDLCKLGEDVYLFNEVHSGVHPCPVVTPDQCSNPLVRRIVDHSGSNCVHFHIGAAFPDDRSPVWTHITGDIVCPTWKVGGEYVHKDGRLCALDSPRIREIAAKYPDRPGLEPPPCCY